MWFLAALEATFAVPAASLLASSAAARDGRKETQPTENRKSERAEYRKLYKSLPGPPREPKNAHHTPARPTSTMEWPRRRWNGRTPVRLAGCAGRNTNKTQHSRAHSGSRESTFHRNRPPQSDTPRSAPKPGGASFSCKTIQFVNFPSCCCCFAAKVSCKLNQFPLSASGNHSKDISNRRKERSVGRFLGCGQEPWDGNFGAPSLGAALFWMLHTTERNGSSHFQPAGRLAGLMPCVQQNGWHPAHRHPERQFGCSGVRRNSDSWTVVWFAIFVVPVGGPNTELC